MLWACLHLPELPLDVLFDGDTAAPCRAVLDGTANRPLIAQANAAAQAAGVRTGHSLAAARVHAPDLVVRWRQPRAESQRLETLAAWAYGYSSQVTLRAPDALLLEVGASLRLFGGWTRLQALLRDGLGALGHRHVLAAAPTPAAAEALACAGEHLALFDALHARNALAALPLPRSGLPERLVQALHAVGWRRLGELLRAPRAELARRFDPALPAWLDRLTGASPDPRPLFRPPDRFDRLIEFDVGIDSLESLGFVLQRLCRELAAYLQARDGGVQQFLLCCGHDDLAATPLEIGLRHPQREAQPLFEAARGKLERSPLPAPVRSLGLHAEHLPPFVPERRDLFDPLPRGDLDWPALHERLRAKLGESAVRGLQLHADHRPEKAYRVAEPTAAYHCVSPPLPNAPRPLWLLPRPQPIAQSALDILGPPERIETGWWDGEDVRRDYVIAELPGGQRAWLYRDAGSNGPWLLHGWFA